MASVFELAALDALNGENNSIKPTYQFFVDWTNSGTFGGTSDDRTNDVVDVDLFYGRDRASQLTGRAVAGRLRVRLLNLSGVYNSFNSSSPIFGKIVPGRRVRLLSTTPYARYLFDGQLVSVIPEMDAQKNRHAILEAAGPLAALDTDVSIPMKTAVTTDVALGTILDNVNWPSTLRDLDTGRTTLTRWWADGLNALDAAREVEATEAGFLRESKDGKVVFENRHARISGTATTSQATYSDATGSLVYSGIMQQDPVWQLFNEFRSQYQPFATSTSTILWTHPEANASGSAPQFVPGQTRVYWAEYPNPTATLNAIAVATWLAPTGTVDYNMFSDTAATGTNLNTAFSVTVTTFATAAKYSVANTGTALAYLTKLQAQGVAVLMPDAVTVSALDASSTGTYRLRRYPRPAAAKWVPNSQEAQDWCDFNVGVYKDPKAFLTVTLPGGRDLLHAREVLTRDISERVTVIATGTHLQLGINDEFYVENIRMGIGPDRYPTVSYELSPAASFSEYWSLGKSKLGTSTRPSY